MSPEAFLVALAAKIKAATIRVNHSIRAANVLIGTYEFERESSPTS